MNELISQLLAIRETAKGIHYTVHGLSFYGLHLLMDEIADSLSEYQDQIKETILLGNGQRPLQPIEYMQYAISIMPKVDVNDDKQNFKALRNLILDTIIHIKGLDKLSKGSENLVGNIAEHLQKQIGLLNLAIEE